MVATPREPSIKELNRKLKRLELLVLALIASDGIGRDIYLDEFFHLFRRFFRDQEESIDDKEFYHFFERLMFESREKGSSLRNSVDHLENLARESREEFQEQRKHFDNRISNVSERARLLEEDLKKSNKELHHYLIFQYLGEDSKNIALDRFIPVRVYLSDDKQDDIDKITNAVDGLLDAFEFQFSDDFPAEKGSWWKKWFAKSKDVITQPEVAERLEKIERAIDIKGLHKPQAEVDKAQAEAIATLIAAINGIPNVAIQAGSILLVKVTDGNGDPSLQVRSLSTKELIYLENNQHLLCKPETVMQSLSCGSSHQQLPAAGASEH